MYVTILSISSLNFGSIMLKWKMLKKEPKIIGKLFGFTGVAYGGIISGSGSF